MGLAITSVRLSEWVADRFDDGRETVFVAFYRYQLTPWLALQPDLQRAMLGAGLAPRRRALMATLRLRLEF